MPRLVVLAITLLSGLALAAPAQQTTGGGCCTLLVFLLFLYIYRAGGADWLRAIGASLFPGIFGWFIWRDRELGTGSRWVAAIFASLHLFSIVTSLVLLALIKGGAFNRFLPPGGFPAMTEERPRPIDLSKVPEDLSLGLHPISSINSDPPGARVFVNGQERGKTPLETPLSAGQRNEVRVELAGFFTATQERSPNAREKLDLSFTLNPAARLKVTTQPPGARVLVAMKEVLARSPGTSAPLELGEDEVLVLLDGYQPHRQKLTLVTETPLDVELTPGVKIAVTSTPDRAEVFLDGAWVGVTPANVFVAPKGKHTVEVKKETWATAKKVFASVNKPVTFDAKLVDTEHVRALLVTRKARARYDKINEALEKAQWKNEHTSLVTEKMERQLAALEREMEKAATVLERAEYQLKAIEEARASGQPLPTPGAEE